MTKIVEFIETEIHRGAGTEANPYRLCPQLWTQDGVLVAEYDPWAETSFFNPRSGSLFFAPDGRGFGRVPVTVVEDTKEGA